MSVFALSMSKVQWLEKGAMNCVVMAAKARPWIPMHHWCLHEHGARDPSVSINMGCGHTRGWLHPRNPLCVGVSGRCCIVFEAFRSCLNVGLCGINDSLQVLCCLGVSGTARNAL